MATRLYFRNDFYRQLWYPGIYNQGANSFNNITQIRWKNNEYFACTPLGSYSTNGINFNPIGTSGPTDAASNANYISTLTGSTVYFLGDTSGRIWRLTAPDQAWTVQTTVTSSSQINDFEEGNGYIVAVASNGVLAYSTNGTSWTESASAKTAFGNNTIWSIAYSSSLNLWVAVGASGAIATATSPNGTWTTRTNNFGANAIYYVIWNSTLSLFIAVGQSGNIGTSSNGTTWTGRTSGITTSIFAITYNLNQIVAGGANSVILRSTDAINWTNARPLPSEISTTNANPINFIEAVNTSSSPAPDFVLCGNQGIFYKSTDYGQNWFPIGTEINSIASQTDAGGSFATYINNWREMTPLIGSSQVAFTQVLPATATAITEYWGTWATRPLKSNATVGGGLLNISTAGSESNGSANWLGVNGLYIYVLRPSTNTIVGTIKSFTGTASFSATEVGTGETSSYNTGISTTAVSALAGDIIVCELWSVSTPAMATNYTSVLYWNGTTVNTTNGASVTNHASFIEFAETIPLPDNPENYPTIVG